MVILIEFILLILVVAIGTFLLSLVEYPKCPKCHKRRRRVLIERYIHKTKYKCTECNETYLKLNNRILVKLRTWLD